MHGVRVVGTFHELLALVVRLRIAVIYLVELVEDSCWADLGGGIEGFRRADRALGHRGNGIPHGAGCVASQVNAPARRTQRPQAKEGHLTQIVRRPGAGRCRVVIVPRGPVRAARLRQPRGLGPPFRHPRLVVPIGLERPRACLPGKAVRGGRLFHSQRHGGVLLPRAVKQVGNCR